MRRVVNHTLISGGALAAVIAALVVLDERVRTAVVDLITGRPSSEVARAGTSLHEMTGVAWDAIQHQSVANAPLMIFVVVATVLMIFMVRT
jgi:hypothetical protein